MTTTENELMIADLEAAIRAVPGVASLYRAGGFISTIVDAGARAFGVRDETASPVRLEPSAEGVGVSVALGVDSTSRAIDVIGRVHSAIVAWLGEHDETPTEINLTVVHIDDSANKKGARS
ncbi:MAG: hypothetical protein ACTH31_15130 [Pseudoclavibacter sp.]